VLVGLAICLPMGSQIFDFLIAPADGKLHDGEFIAKKLYEVFMTDLKVGFFGAFILAMPVIAWQMWGFVAPGLYKTEKRMVWPFVILSTLLFVGGIALCYYGILPYAIEFFTNYNQERGFTSLLTVSDYLSFIIRFLVAFGAVFQTPLIIFFLARMGLVTAKGLRHFRRYAIVLGFALAAMITPPDPGSQIAVALPFIVLYEVGIITAALWGRPPLGQRSEADEVEDSSG
jgi:sec-independent protein translocase protein TatC